MISVLLFLVIQGNPGEGKTTLALWIAAICSQGQALPGMESHDPINILYQTAEDGLGDTIKLRLINAGADLNRIICIDETERSLSLLDERIEKAVKDSNAKLMILDPLQGYLGRDVNMNRANEIRDVPKRLITVAEQTGCAIVLIGHLNKAEDAMAVARSQEHFINLLARKGYKVKWTGKRKNITYTTPSMKLRDVNQ